MKHPAIHAMFEEEAIRRQWCNRYMDPDGWKIGKQEVTHEVERLASFLIILTEELFPHVRHVDTRVLLYDFQQALMEVK